MYVAGAGLCVQRACVGHCWLEIDYFCFSFSIFVVVWVFMCLWLSLAPPATFLPMHVEIITNTCSCSCRQVVIKYPNTVTRNGATKWVLGRSWYILYENFPSSRGLADRSAAVLGNSSSLKFNLNFWRSRSHREPTFQKRNIFRYSLFRECDSLLQNFNIRH